MLVRNQLMVLLLIFFTACVGGSKKEKSMAGPEGYAWQTPEKIALPEELDEISGIYYDSSRNAIIAVNDEQGQLYLISLSEKNPISNFRFHKGADYEDIIFVDPYIYALKSNGNLFKISFPFTDSVKTSSTPLSLKGKNDFEAILYDAPLNQLLIFCKSCEAYKDSPAVFSYNLSTGNINTSPVLTINLKEEHAALLKKKEKLQISAAAVHPVTGEWYIIASANHLLLIADGKGNILQAFPLNKKMFKQPEGICFSPGGDLFISNEARNGIANILRFPFTGR